jgi:hypothetical protein
MDSGGKIVTDTLYGFNSLFEYNASISAGTRVFSFLKLGKNVLRHVMVPQISFRYQPDFSRLDYGNIGPGGSLASYSPFESAIFGLPSTGKQGMLGLSLNNNLEGKFKSRKEETGMK